MEGPVSDPFSQCPKNVLSIFWSNSHILIALWKHILIKLTYSDSFMKNPRYNLVKFACTFFYLYTINSLCLKDLHLLLSPTTYVGTFFTFFMMSINASWFMMSINASWFASVSYSYSICMIWTFICFSFASLSYNISPINSLS